MSKLIVVCHPSSEEWANEIRDTVLSQKIKIVIVQFSDRMELRDCVFVREKIDCDDCMIAVLECQELEKMSCTGRMLKAIHKHGGLDKPKILLVRRRGCTTWGISTNG